LSADKPIETAGWPGYAFTVFARMHYGVTADLAARCLWLLLVVTVGTALVALCSRSRKNHGAA